MTRPLRQLRYSPIVHVWSRGADRHDIVLDDHDRIAFIESVASATERQDITVHAFALMSNHHHMILESLDGTAMPISEAMHRIGTETARRHNHRYERTGPLFENRFGMREITTDRQLHVVGRYVHRNPMALPVSLLEYPFSSFRAYAGLVEPPPWLTTDRLLGVRAGDPDRYAQFVLRQLPGEADTTAPQSPWGQAELDAIDEAITTRWTSVSDTDRRGIAAALALSHRIANAAEIAHHQGFVSPAAARSAARRARSRRSVDPRFDARMTAIERDLGRVPMSSSRRRAA